MSPVEPAAARDPLPSDAIVLGLDIGGTQIRAAAITAGGERLERRATATPGESADAIVRACAEMLAGVRGALSAEASDRVVAIGISSMGPVNPWRGVVVDPPNVPALRDSPLADEMERLVGLPAYLERDTNVSALAEQCRERLPDALPRACTRCSWRRPRPAVRQG